MEKEQSKSILEALIFVSDSPLEMVQIRDVLEGASEEEIQRLVQELNNEYQATGRSFTIQQIAGGYRMVTLPQFGPHLKALYKSRMKERLTRPSLETLAIIAYKQPVTKPEIEAIRGVNTDGVIITLLERNLIRITGRKDTVGRPLLYGTTDEFLQHFGLGSLSDMPKLPEMQQMTEAKDDAVQTS
jgi:segregation and condensation protein B